MSVVQQGERIAALEVEVAALKHVVQQQNVKLDTLIGLKNKGAGAFWLASILFGTGIVTCFTAFMDWLKT